MFPLPPPLMWVSGGILAIAGLAGAVVLFQFNPAIYPIYPICQFHRLTGLNCPGCGATRALYQLLHGHILTALRYNAPLVLALPLVAAGALRRYLSPLPPRRLSWYLKRPFWPVVLGVVLILYAVLRNLPGEPFIYLSPP